MNQGDPGATSPETPAPASRPPTAPEAKPLPARIPLNGPQQAAAGALGFGALVAGVFAVFQTDNEAGSTALLIVGLLLTIVTLAKQVPTSLKAGDNEMAFQAGEEAGAARKAVEIVAAASEAAEVKGASPEKVAAAVREAAAAPFRSFAERVHEEWARSRTFGRLMDETAADPRALAMFRYFAEGGTVQAAADRAGLPQPEAYRLVTLYAALQAQGDTPPSLPALRLAAARDFGTPEDHDA